MSVLEHLIGIISPPTCVVCGYEGSALCDVCMVQLISPSVECCLYCQALNNDYKTCSKCRRTSRIYAGASASSYQPAVKSLIIRYKLTHQRAAVKPLVELMIKNQTDFLSGLPQGCLVVCTPTSTNHHRARGFDHGRLLAQSLASKAGMNFYSALHRRGQARQLGSRRTKRLEQLRGRFYVPDYKSSKVKGKFILLIDDVMTTGATLEESGRALREAGAKRIYVLVAARKK